MYGFGVGSHTSRVVSLSNSVSRTAWHSLCSWLIVGSETRPQGIDSSAKKYLNLFENAKASSVSQGVTTSPSTIRRRWKVLTPNCGHLGFLLALVKHGFGVGSYTVGWCHLGIQSLGLIGILFVLAFLWGAKLVARGESPVKECLNLFEISQAAIVLLGVATSPLTVRRRWKVMTPACGHPGFLLALVKHGFGVGSCTGRVGAKHVARGESSAKECLNLFENARAASVSPGVTTSCLTVRKRWKVMTPTCGLLGFLLA